MATDVIYTECGCSTITTDAFLPISMDLFQLAYEGGWPMSYKVKVFFDTIIRMASGGAATTVTFTAVDGNYQTNANLINRNFLLALVDNQPYQAVGYKSPDGETTGTLDFSSVGGLSAGQQIKAMYTAKPAA